jgi:hypothetical protein
MIKRIFSLISILILLSLLLSSCSNFINMGLNNNPDEYVTYKEHNTEIKPQKVINLGESFDFFIPESKGTGHFSCTVTGARVLTDESQIAVDDPNLLLEGDKLIATIDGEDVFYSYDEWFTEGGAFDQGCRFILVDLSVTNVDAQGWLDSEEPRGFFEERYAFHAYDFISLANLSRYTEVDGQYNFARAHCRYFDKMGDLYSEDILTTWGYELYAIQILPGQTVTYTLGYGVNTDLEGNPVALSDLMVVAEADRNAETGIFIDLALGDD